MSTRAFRTALGLEALLLRRSPAIWWTLALLVVLTVAAAWNGHARVAAIQGVIAGLNDDERQTQAALKATTARWEQAPTPPPPTVTSPGTVGFSLLSHYAALPAANLAPLAAGQSDIMPSYVRVTANPAYTFLTVSEIINPLNALTGGFDVAFVIVFILPIVIIALTFDLISREKESGVMGLAAASGAALTRIMFAKVCARVLVIAVTLLAMSVLVMWIGSTGSVTLGLWAGWLALVSVYAAFWFALALFVNSRSRPSVTNGVILANVWLVFVVVMPAFVNTIADALYPAPSRVALTTAMREAAEEADESAADARQAYFFDHPDMAGKGANLDDYFVQVISTNAAVEKVVAPLLAQFDVQAARRDATVRYLEFLSPALVTQQALTALSGTDPARFADFTRQVLDFHRRWRTFFESRILKGERMTSAAFDEIPAFDHVDPGLDRGRLAQAVASLAAATVLLTLWALRRLRRFPVV